jgi:hypothetical protein
MTLATACGLGPRVLSAQETRTEGAENLPAAQDNGDGDPVRGEEVTAARGFDSQIGKKLANVPSPGSRLKVTVPEAVVVHNAEGKR